MKSPTPCVFLLILSIGVSSIALCRAESPSDIVAVGIPKETATVYTWYRTGFVSQGTSDNLGRHRAKYRFVLPTPLTPDNIVGISGFRESMYHGQTECNWLTLYDNYTMSVGTSDNLARCNAEIPYTLPQGKTAQDIVDIGIRKDRTNREDNTDKIYVFYRDGTLSVGFFRWSGSQLAYAQDKWRWRGSAPLLPFTLPNGFSAPDLVGVDIAPNGDHVFAWFNNGYVMSGTWDNLFRYRLPYTFAVPE